LIGKTVQLPLTNVEIPVIGDTYVDPAFGTGALKITPAHDANDYEVARRHNLDPVWVMDETGCMKADELRVPAALHGMDRMAARRETEAMLHAQSCLQDKTPHHHSVGHCQRCGTTIEPYLSQQWFVRCSAPEIKDRVLAALDADEPRFVPERWTKVYRDWIENLRDWCISRQLWWGHQIPAWYCENDHITVADSTPTQCGTCGAIPLRQETDVLDTWFSSGLWPFSTMGWPDTEAPDYKDFYPTTVLVTGFDIIFFWVARMVMLGVTLTDQVPFQDVYIHGLIRDEKGQKMSKSKGNTIDPVEIINTYGCDALRFSLTSLVTGGQDIKLSKDSFEQGKLFANKLWNASRFVLMNLDGVDDQPIDTTPLSNMDRWIMAELESTQTNVNDYLEHYQFAAYADAIYAFTWNSFCDWYVEYAKKPLREDATRLNTQRVLLHVLHHILRMLHPIMPFITEEIGQKLPHQKGASLMVCLFPGKVYEERIKEEITVSDTVQVDMMGYVLDLIRCVRNLRQSSGIPHSQPLPVTIETADPNEQTALNNNRDVLHQFLKLSELHLTSPTEGTPPNTLVGVIGGSRVLVSLAGTVDMEAEAARQRKKLETLEKEFTQLADLLANPGFVERAPAVVVQRNRDRLDELNRQITIITEQLAQWVE
jgi:valyl-tRNA synthetase